jgi:galactonate dehydratase
MDLSTVKVNERTEWTFAEIYDAQGAVAVVEVTIGSVVQKILSALTEAFAALRGVPVENDGCVADLLGLTTDELRNDLGLATAVSALRTAMVNIQTQCASLSMTEALGGERQISVPLYANINRSLIAERTPSEFAAAAEKAVRIGFRIVKCAPFDEVRPSTTADQNLEAARPGLERVAAVREAIGPEVTLLVDCHARFQFHTATSVAEKLARLEVGWFEEPLDTLTEIYDLSRLATETDIPLAGGELGYGEELFASLIERNAVRIIMPDVKYCGGVAEACRSGKAALRLGGQVSLHSPSGPISQLASAHVTAAIPGALALEHAVNETSWRTELLVPSERIERGHLFYPQGTGLGATLNEKLVQRHGSRRRLYP